MTEWRNWSGTVVCHPRHLYRPQSEDDLAGIVRRLAHEDGTLRVVGAGHSFTPLCQTADTLVALDGLRGVIATNRAACEATIWAGTTLAEVGEPLLLVDLALENQGDVDYQTLAGAIATGTHGTGLAYGSLSTQVLALRLLLASGEYVTCSPSLEPDLFAAARLALGLLGVVSQVTLRLLPAYRLHERTWVASFDETMRALDEQIRANAHFEFFWLPQHDAAILKALQPTTAVTTHAGVPPPAPPGTLARYLRPERVDWSHRIFPSARTTPFVEMEYAVPFAAGPDCYCELRQLMRQRHPRVSWAVEYRTQRADDVYLSPAYQRDCVTISVHESPQHPYQAFFADAEVVFRNHGGRPHWAKLHSLRAPALRQLYPMWDQFLAVRTRVDPQGRFLNRYLRTLLLEE